MNHYGLFFFFILFFFLYCFSLLYFLMGVLRVGSLNVNGLRDKVKNDALLELIKLKNINVILLQETHSDYRNEVDWGLWWEGESCLSHGSNTSAGVAILFFYCYKG